MPLVIRGRYRGVATERTAAAITVTGRDVRDQVWTTKAEALPARVNGHSSLWARSFLRQLEDDYELTERKSELGALRDRITELSQDFGVLCRFTALIAIDPQRPEERSRQQSLRRVVQPVLGESLLGDLDLEPLVAGSGYPAGDSGLLVDDGSADIGSAVSSGSSFFCEGGINLEGDDVKPWDVDLGEFMSHVEVDVDAATMLGGGTEFDLDATSSDTGGECMFSAPMPTDQWLKSRTEPVAELARDLARLLEFLRPRGSQNEELSWWRLRLFLIRFWKSARKAARAGADSAEVERLAVVAFRLFAHADDWQKVTGSLDQLADAAELFRPVRRWWQTRAVFIGRPERFWD